MADDVYDSWEDIIENGNMKILQRSSVSSPSISTSSSTTFGNQQTSPSSSSGAVNNGENSTFKILRRPPNLNNEETIATRSSINDNNYTSKRYDLNKYVNSQPFIPQNYQRQESNGNSNNINSNNNNNNNGTRILSYPQIQLEDNTRTQYVKPVKILKRPSKSDENKISPSKNFNGQGSQQTANGKTVSQMKTYEEREAEYRLARLRILGSAKPTYDDTLNDTCVDTYINNCKSVSNDANTSSSNTTNSTLHTSRSSLGLSRMNGEITRNQNNVPILRLPQGPDGTRGFAVKR